MYTSCLITRYFGSAGKRESWTTGVDMFGGCRGKKTEKREPRTNGMFSVCGKKFEKWEPRMSGVFSGWAMKSEKRESVYDIPLLERQTTTMATQTDNPFVIEIPSFNRTPQSVSNECYRLSTCSERPPAPDGVYASEQEAGAADGTSDIVQEYQYVNVEECRLESPVVSCQSPETSCGMNCLLIAMDLCGCTIMWWITVYTSLVKYKCYFHISTFFSRFKQINHRMYIYVQEMSIH